MNLVTVQIISLVFIAVSALVFILLERWRPYTPGLKIFREGLWTDFLLYTLAQSYLAGIIIAYFASWLDGVSAGRPEVVTSWPVWLQVLFFLVLHDLYIWWFHKLCHSNKYLYRLHEAHHSPREVDWLSGARSHFLEILINGFVEFLPIILLGAAPEVALIKGAISAVWGMFIHANLDVKLGRLGYVINGPELHRWHHANDPRGRFRNFGTKLSVWDWMWGTAYHPDLKPESYGLPYDYPLNNYFKQHWAALRPFRRKGTA